MLEVLVQRAFGVELAVLAPIFALVLARALPLAFLAPWLGLRSEAITLRVAAVATLAVALTPLALHAAPAPPVGALALTLAVLREAILGVTFAVAASLPLFALSWVGALLDRQRSARASSNTLATVHLLAGVGAFIALGGPRLVVGALGETLVDLPPGTTASGSPEDLVLGSARLVSDALGLALSLGAPLALALVIAELATGLVDRIAPAMSRALAELPLRGLFGLAVALLGLAVVLPRLGPAFAGSIDAAVDLVRRAGP